MYNFHKLLRTVIAKFRRKGGRHGYETAHASVAETEAANEATSKMNAKPPSPPGRGKE